MQKTPSRDPRNPQVYLTDETGAVVYMSKTGKPEEFIHTSILQTIIQLVAMNPSFLPSDPNTTPPLEQIQRFMETYANYVNSYYTRVENAKTKKG